MNNMYKKLNQNSYNLFPLLVSNLIFFLIKPFIKIKPVEFPKTIGEYIFESKVTGIKLWKCYLLGIYRNPKGGKAIFKMKDARIKDYNYYSLRNEIVLYEILNEVILRLNSSLPKKFNDIYIPKKIDVVDNKNILGILVEYVGGSTAQKLSAHQKTQAYFKIIEFLSYLGDHFTDQEKKRISKRGSLHYLLLYPFLVIKAIISYPRSTIYVMSGIPLFLGAFLSMLRDREIALIHRDIHFENILISNKRLVLVDLEQCVLTDPLYEVITTLRYYWKGDGFYLLLLDSIFQKYSFRKNFKLLFRGLIVNSATHGLTGRNYPKRTIDAWISFLKYGISYSDNVKKD